LNGSPDSVCRYLHKFFRLTAQVSDAAQLGKFITTLGAAVQMLLLGRCQRIIIAECAVGQPIRI
jgi:hypothetical protein